ncbi:MAG TPA: hypothetical protein DCQ50_14660 [Chryseobacterium sp.]|nr:hypothetical protein [Chryseobacterium gambrini]HAO08188.1 hypothetical protein [Chryseobacterium sp.]
MRKTLLFLLFSAFVFGQDIVRDSLSENGRLIEFRVGESKLTLNTAKPINDFKNIGGVLTTDGNPYFGLKFFPYDLNSEVILMDLKNDPKFNVDFPNSTISFEGVHNITSYKVFTDSKKRKVYNKVKIYAISGGLLWMFFNVEMKGNNTDASENQVKELIDSFTLQDNYFALNPNLQY